MMLQGDFPVAASILLVGREKGGLEMAKVENRNCHFLTYFSQFRLAMLNEFSFEGGKFSFLKG